MIRVNYVALADDASSFYRCQGVFPYINEHNLVLTDISHLNYGSWVNMLSCDVLFMQRPFDESHLYFITQAKNMGKKIIVDFDDLITDVPEHNPCYSLYLHNKKHILQILRIANEVWVSTESLKQQWSRYNKNIYVISNAHNDYVFPVEKKKNFNRESKTIFYRGGDTHRLDLMGISAEISIIAKNNSCFNFYFMGCDDNHEFRRINSENSNVMVTNGVPFIQYFNHLCELNPLLMLCPLEETTFNSCKSNISWLEGTYAGAAFVGKKTLPEFSYEPIFNIDKLGKFEDYIQPKRAERFHNESWNYIKNNLLLSITNQQRINRLLS